jgi:hypothetical protein
MDTPNKLRQSTEVMANVASVPMDVWDIHSNNCMDAAREIETLRAQLAEAQEALVAHNDYLRSAAAIAARYGQKTGWDHFLKAVTTTLSTHHAVTNKARQALSKLTEDAND